MNSSSIGLFVFVSLHRQKKPETVPNAKSVIPSQMIRTKTKTRAELIAKVAITGGQTDDDDGNLCKSNWKTIIFPANCFELRASFPADGTRYVESLDVDGSENGVVN